MPDCSNQLLSIVIPVHNQSAYTRACLTSLAAFPPHVPFEIIVVDDASSDDTPRLLATAAVGEYCLRTIRNETSLGFAGSCNRGASVARGEFLLLLNNDTEVLSGWFQPLYEIITNYPDIGLVAPKLIFPNRTIQHCGKVWSDLNDPTAQPHHIYYRFPADHPAVNKSRDYQMLTGACVVLRTAEFQALGGFDEGYLNGWEDDDLCYKYLSKGRRVYYCATSEVIHHQNITLNERMKKLERSLPEAEQLQKLDQTLASGYASESDIQTARHVQATFVAMEQELASVRKKFDCNRALFLKKWGDRIQRDDLRYCTEDNIPLNEALPEIYSSARYTYASGVNMPLVSIVILTRNRLDVTRECVASISRHTPEHHEIIFVDNGSTDGTVDWLREQISTNNGYRLIENGANRGFSAGCNQGILAAQGEYILLLNNDVVVTPEWLGGMLECFSTHHVGIVGPMTNNISGIQRWPWVGYTDMQELMPFAAQFRMRYRFRRVPSRRIVGFCMLFRKELVESIGILDELFGSGNFEDDDFCLRAALAGYQNIIAGDVFIHHIGSATFQGNQINYAEAMLKNQGLFNEKWSRPVVNVVQAKSIVCLKTLEKAELLRLAGEVDAAVELLLQEGIKQIPDEPNFYLALARVFLEAGMPKDAIDVLKESPDQGEAVSLLIAQALLEAGNIADAATLLDVISTVGDTAELLVIRGNLFLVTGDLDTSGKMYERALANNPACAGAYAGLATLATHVNDLDLAFDLLERALSCNLSDIRLRNRFHSLVANSKQLELAEQLMLETAHFFPGDADCAYLHVDLLLRQNRSVDALGVIERILAVFKPKPGFLAAALAVREQVGILAIAPERYQSGTSVSLCMIMKDEAANLARSLASLKPIVDEIIIVDTGSSDSSREIARIFGAQVIETTWTGDFSAARNASLAQAHGNWILVMDPDEVISIIDHDHFRQLIADSVGKLVAGTIETRNYTNRVDLENWRANKGEYPLEEAGRGWMPSDKIRLFPNLAAIRFENPIHEMVEPAIARLGIPDPKVDIPVHHYGYLDDQRQQRKLQFYYELGKKKMEESGGAPHAVVELAIQAAAVGRYDEAIDLWQRALEFDPVSPLAFFNLGHAYLQKGMFREGSDACLRAMELRDNYREALINQLMCELCLGGGEELLAIIDTSSIRNPDYPLLQLMHGVVQAVVGNTDEALRDFRALLDDRVDFSRFVHEVAVKLIMAGRDKEAGRLVSTAGLAGIGEV